MTEQEYIGEVERCRDRMVGVAQAYVRNTADAEDIVQEVLTKLWLLKSSIPYPFDAIAFRAVRNKSIDLLRHRQRHQSESIDIESLNNQLEHIADEESRAAEREEQIEQVLSAMGKLPSQQNIMLRMRYLKGMATTEMAQITGATEVSVRQTLSRARVNLLKHLTTGIVAACLLIIASLNIFNAYQNNKALQMYEGSYMIVDGKRIDDIKIIKNNIEQTLIMASETENDINRQDNDINDIENEALSAIADPIERNRLQQILSE